MNCSLSKNNGLFVGNEREAENEQQKKVHIIVQVYRNMQLEFCNWNNYALQVMADIVSSALNEKNTPAFEATDKVFAADVM